MRKLILSAVLILCLAFCLALASCGGGSEPTGTASTTQAAGETTATPDRTTTAEKMTAAAATTVDVWETYGPEVAAMDAADRSLRFKLDSSVTAEKTSKNKDYLEGPDEVEEGATPAILQMVFERNQAARELLDVQIDYTYWDYTWGQQQKQIEKVVQGAAADAPDLFVEMIYDLCKANQNGCFKDIWSIPGSYFDFDAPGWMNDWMKTMSFTGDRAYMLAGDYFVDILRAFGVLPFNLTMMEENAEKLSPALLGEPVGSGEELSSRFFDLVEEGGWTWELFGKLCEAIWVDNDGNGADSIKDQLGIIVDLYSGLPGALYIYSCGEELFEVKTVEDPADPNAGKQWIYYPESDSAIGGIFDAVAGVYSGKGSLAVSSSGLDAATEDDPGVAYHRIMFASRQTLTAGACVLGALEDDAFQRMSDIYSVLPLPKVNASKKYNTIIHNVGDAGAINVNTTPGKARALSAFLQYCTGNSGEIREEFLQIVTKYKTTTYNQGTDRMLEIIYGSVLNARDKALEDVIGGNYRWNVIIKGNNYERTSAYIATSYAASVSSKQATLNGILTKWYTLPKVDAVTPAE